MVPQRRGLGGKAGRQEKAFSWADGLSRGVAGPEEGKEVQPLNVDYYLSRGEKKTGPDRWVLD